MKFLCLVIWPDSTVIGVIHTSTGYDLYDFSKLMLFCKI